MTTATTPGTAADVQVLRHQARMCQYVVGLNLEGVTHEDSLIQPSPDGNCLNWVVGHLTAIYQHALRLLGQEPVMPEGALARYDRGSAPIRDAAEARRLEELVAAWNETTRRIDAGLAALSPETLDQPAPFSPEGDPNETVRSLLTAIAWHQAYHAGQTGILRRIAGKPGAIR
ncbi:MAG TPA: DinB family protein [Gemmatimonadaceae bacterium]|nr:DinB family protein [Gemmatimonadaceae bacterium]